MLIRMGAPEKPNEIGDGFLLNKSILAMKQLNLASAKKFDEYFADFGDDMAYFYASDGKVSSYQLVNYFLDKFAERATVYITTWGFTETALRQLALRKKSGQINELFFVFSDKTKVNKANEFQLATSVATAYKIHPCHAKIYLVRTKNHQVSLITSGNLNRNNKLEAGVITSSKSIWDGYANFLDKIIKS
jgi:hypothetical protein